VHTRDLLILSGTGHLLCLPRCFSVTCSSRNLRNNELFPSLRTFTKCRALPLCRNCLFSSLLVNGGLDWAGDDAGRINDILLGAHGDGFPSQRRSSCCLSADEADNCRYKNLPHALFYSGCSYLPAVPCWLCCDWAVLLLDSCASNLIYLRGAGYARGMHFWRAGREEGRC